MSDAEWEIYDTLKPHTAPKRFWPSQPALSLITYVLKPLTLIYCNAWSGCTARPSASERCCSLELDQSACRSVASAATGIHSAKVKSLDGALFQRWTIFTASTSAGPARNQSRSVSTDATRTKPARCRSAPISCWMAKPIYDWPGHQHTQTPCESRPCIFRCFDRTFEHIPERDQYTWEVYANCLSPQDQFSGSCLRSSSDF